MKTKIRIVTLAIAAIATLLLTTGCSMFDTSPVLPIVPEEPVIPQEPANTPKPAIPEEPAPDSSGFVDNSAQEDKATEVVLPTEGRPPDDMTWISPGKVLIGNFYPGATAEYPITLHNGNNTTASFAVAYRIPDHVGEEYSKPTEEVQDWVIIIDTTPILNPRETRDILVVLDMPSDATSPASKWEFWVSVVDTTQTGMVQTELCSRWLVSMR